MPSKRNGKSDKSSYVPICTGSESSMGTYHVQTRRRPMPSKLYSTNDWRPSSRLKAIVLSSLLYGQRAFRSDDLWEECRSQIKSKTSFGKVVRDLETEGLVLRNETSHKHVEFRLNLNDDRVKRLVSWTKTVVAARKEEIMRYERLAETLRSSFLQQSDEHTRWDFEAMIFSHASSMAKTIVQYTFEAADLAAGGSEDLLLDPLIQSSVLNWQNSVKSDFVLLLKTDADAARKAFSKWVESIDKPTIIVIKRALKRAEVAGSEQH